jgi:hypothetical protein
MTLADFERAPWQNSHRTYKDSVLSVSPAPEYASSEILLASLYRTIGFAGVGDPGVPQAGRDLEKSMQRMRGKPSGPDGASANAETWNAVLHAVLESPKLPNQSSRRFVQVTPLVPGFGLFSGSARLTSNSWPAGSLVRRMVCLGSPDLQSAQRLWKELFDALSVREGDDIFARWLEAETHAWTPGHDWTLVPIPDGEARFMSTDDFADVQFLPARQFVQDLAAVIRANDAMTRRQWTSLLESVVRLAGVAHVAWLCDVQSRAWRCMSDALSSGGPRGKAEARQAIFPHRAQYMTYGGKAQPALKDKVSGYLVARLGINALLWSLEDAGVPFQAEILSSGGVAALCAHIRANHAAIEGARVREVFLDVREREARALNCAKGIGMNMLEFARHVLGQRQAASPLLRGYDQGYVLKKKGTHAASPWVVSLGPVAVLALVHCAMAGLAGPRSIHRLARQLGAYGIAIDRQEIAASDLGHQLRMLGLLLDSPDAESGMLLIPPFPSRQPG